jgi:hypothetical protein
MLPNASTAEKIALRPASFKFIKTQNFGVQSVQYRLGLYVGTTRN